MKRFLALFITLVLVMGTMPVIAEASDSTYDEYVVKFKDGYSPYGGAMLMSAEDSGVEPVIEDWNVYTVAADMIGNLDMSHVEYIEPNYRAVLLESYPNDPYYEENQKDHFFMIGMQKVWQMAFREPRYLARGVKVAVIDSGIDVDHPDLDGTDIVAYNYTQIDASGNVVNKEYNVEEENEDSLHGTSVAGVIAAGFNNGVGMTGMTKATIYSLKAFGSSSDVYKNVCRAIKDAVDVYDCDVINMSLGFVSKSGEAISTEDYSGMRLLQENIDYAVEKGAIVVAASGNYAQKDGTAEDLPDGCKKNPIVYPAYCDNVISVGAVQSTGAIASFSSYNDMVDVVAPGVGIGGLCGYYPFNEKYYCKKELSEDGRYIYDYRLNGTSFAAPQVAAAAAIIKGVHPEINQAGMEALIKNLSKDLGDEGRDDYYGWGLIDIGRMATLMSPNVVNEVKPGEAKYNWEERIVSVNYFNSRGEALGGVAARLAIYDENDRLVKITEPHNIIFSAYDEEKVVFEGIEIPDGGYAKIFCLDWGKIKPVAEIVPLYF